MQRDISIRTYRPEDLPALVALINEADASRRAGAGNHAGKAGARNELPRLLCRHRLLPGLAR